MNILLIAPPLDIRSTRKIFPRHPPYVLLSVAAHLERAGFNVKAYDAFLEQATIQDIKEVVSLCETSLIGISPADITRFPPIEVDIELIKSLKTDFPKIPIVIFGVRNENIIKTLLKTAKAIDYVLLGDPEEIMVELVHCIDRNGQVKHIQGLFMRDSSGNFHVTGSPRVIDNLDSLLFPAWHLTDLSRYTFFPHRYKIPKVYPITTARGCPWNRCIFCKEISIAKAPPYRTRSAENVVSEIEFAMKKYGNLEIQFADAHFNTNIDWLRRFQAGIKQLDRSFSWSCLSRVDSINKEVVKIMSNTGCWNIVFGVETSSQRLLDIIDKGITVKQIRNAIRLCKDSGIETTGSFLLGLPKEQPEDVINSAKFAIDAGLDYVQFFIAKWYDDHEQFRFEGNLLKNWDYTQFDFRGRIFIPKSYRSLKHLKKIQLKAYWVFYTHPYIIIRHLKRIKNLKELKRLFLGFLTFLKMNIEKALFF